MFRIRRIHDDSHPANQVAIRDCQRILADRFSGVRQEDISQIAERLNNPFKHEFRTILYVAENARGEVLGFAIAMFDPILHFCYLDFLATTKLVRGRGVGGALYEHVRREAAELGAIGVFFECLPDGPEFNPTVEIRRQNQARLKFYERYGARPIVDTEYETPTTPGGSKMLLPHLVYDNLDGKRPLKAVEAQRVVRALLERKYSHLCTPEYIDRVVSSFRDDPIRLREFRYVQPEEAMRVRTYSPAERVGMTINDRHQIHHIRERGYVESPARIGAIAESLRKSGLVSELEVKPYSQELITSVHTPALVNYLEAACADAPVNRSVYPYVFPIRNAARPPKYLSVQAGYYCIDTFTPIHRNAYAAARHAVDCTLTAADEILSGRRKMAYALVRPPGHHAERNVFGGFCYLNNAAIAAHYFAPHGRVALLDIDYHHGNGQQEIFYERADVLTISIHGDPSLAYPYFTGFADETGLGEGEGYNLNMPLAEEITADEYRTALGEALGRVVEYDPKFLIVSLGLDTAKGDPTGTWHLSSLDFERNGRMIGQLKLPTLVVQEGGYRTRTLGSNARRFFTGLVAAMYAEPVAAKR